MILNKRQRAGFPTFSRSELDRASHRGVLLIGGRPLCTIPTLALFGRDLAQLFTFNRLGPPLAADDDPKTGHRSDREHAHQDQKVDRAPGRVLAISAEDPAAPEDRAEDD